jgi:hypothetical protein
MGTEVIVDRTRVTSAPSLARRVSWGAIFAGLFVTIVIQLLFTLLGLAVGVVSMESMRDQGAAHRLAIGAGTWLLVTGLISIWVGSCVSGRLCGGPLRSDGLIHGIVCWSVSTCATMFLLATTAGVLLGGTGALLNGALAVGGAATGNDATIASLQDAFPQAGGKLSPTGRTEGDQGNQSSQSAQVTQQQQNQTDQQSQNSGTSSQSASRGLAQGALWGCIALVLGLLMAAWGGWAGVASLPVIETTTTTQAAPPRT